VRALEMSWSASLRRRVSFVKRVEQDAVVWVRRSDWERVTEREELVGRLSLGSRFPQYLMTIVSCASVYPRRLTHFTTAMFTGAKVLAR